MMKFSLCFCFKRNRERLDAPLKKVSYSTSNPPVPIVTSSAISIASDGVITSNYENIPSPLMNEERNDNNQQIDTKTSIDNNTYAKIISEQTPQDVDTELYARIDKTKKAKNAIKSDTDATDITARSKSTPVSLPQPILSSKFNGFNSAKTSPHVPQSLPIYTNITVNTSNDNRHDAISNSLYENIVTPNSLQVQQSSSKTYFLLSNTHLDNAVTSTKQNHQLQGNSNSRVSNTSATNDSISHIYATVKQTENIEDESTTDHALEEVGSVKF